jgi:hypothetical protein
VTGSTRKEKINTVASSERMRAGGSKATQLGLFIYSCEEDQGLRSGSREGNEARKVTLLLATSRVSQGSSMEMENMGACIAPPGPCLLSCRRLCPSLPLALSSLPCPSSGSWFQEQDQRELPLHRSRLSI